MAANKETQRRYQAALRRVLTSYRADHGEADYRRRFAEALAAVDGAGQTATPTA